MSFFFLNATVLRSRSASIFAHVSSMCPSEILEMRSGGRSNSSTSGPSAFSTSFLLSSLLLSAVDRFCRDSMSADTVARSLRKLVRLCSTELRTSSHAAIDLWRSSSLAFSFSPMTHVALVELQFYERAHSLSSTVCGFRTLVTVGSGVSDAASSFNDRPPKSASRIISSLLMALC